MVRDRLMSSGPDRTQYAQQAIEFTDIFKFRFQAKSIGIRKPRSLELSEPDGLSTAGGRLARQNLVLVAESAAVSPIVLGWVDPPNQKAELRSYQMLSRHFEARHGRTLDLELAEYERLENDLRDFFRKQKIDLARVDAPVPAPKLVPEPASQGAPDTTASLLVMLGVGVGLGLGLGYVLFGV